MPRREHNDTVATFHDLRPQISETTESITESDASHTVYHLDDIQAHVDQVFGARAVIASSRVALECITQISTLEVVVTKVIMTSPGSKESKDQKTKVIRKSILN